MVVLDQSAPEETQVMSQARYLAAINYKNTLWEGGKVSD